MIGFISGVMPVALLASLPPVVFSMVLGFIGLLLGLLGRGRLTWYCSGVLLGIFAGLHHGYLLLEKRPSAACELSVVEVEGTVSSLPRITRLRGRETQQRFEFKTDRVSPGHCAGPRTLLLSYYGKESLRPGQRWRLLTRLKRPWGLANPGSFNTQSWYAQSGIDATGSVGRGSLGRLPDGAQLGYVHQQLRFRISRQLATLSLSPEAISILRALTVADKSGMDRSTWGLFQRYGISHLLVISGLHVGLVAGLGLVLGQAIARLALLLGRYRVAAVVPGLLALLLALGYAAIAGFSLPTTRALIMLAAFISASLLDRHSPGWNNLLLAALAVLALNPLAGLGSGFWLSFGAVAWLLWMAQWRRQGGKLKQLAVTHLGIAALMIPLGGWWFGGASAVAAAANLVLIPLVGVFVVPLALAGVTIELLMPPWGEPLLQLAVWPLEQFITLAQRFEIVAVAPLYWVFTPTLPSVIVAIGALATLVVSCRASVVALVCLLVVPLAVPRGRSWDPQVYIAKLTVLDVGQGTAIVLQGPEHTLVYDTGGGDPKGSNMAENVILPYLRQQGVSSLDELIVSHADNDHSAGVATLLESVPVERLLYGGNIPQGYLGAPCRGGQAWRWSAQISFQILSAGRETDISSNNASCVLQLHLGGTRVLLPGDIDRKREKQLVRYWRDALQSDWLLAAHHGSATSTSRVWLKTVQPGHTAFSSGYGNAFGHPHPDIVQRIIDAGGDYQVSGAEGAVEYYLTRNGHWHSQAFRRKNRRFWF